MVTLDSLDGKTPCLQGVKIDVCSARMEYYAQPASLPQVSLSSIKMDLYRRGTLGLVHDHSVLMVVDFTINAQAIQISPKSEFGALCDFFRGQEDLHARILRVLHSLSFIDDPSRIMRCIRFSSRFGFEIGP